MCLIILKKPDAIVPVEHLRNGFANNNDGWGIAYCDEKGTIKVRKSLTGVQHFLEVYELTAKTYPLSPLLVHFRLATHGSRDSSMCHPFYAAKGSVAVAHNGILSSYGSPMTRDDFNLSDTARFIERRLTPLINATKWKDLFTAEWREALGKEIGLGNKLALLTHNGGYIVINPEMGHWKDGSWYSNHGYEDRHYYCQGAYDSYDISKRRSRWRRKDDDRQLAIFDNEGNRVAEVDGNGEIETVGGGSVGTDAGEDDLDMDRSIFRRFEPGLMECDMCKDHIKGAFYMERGGDTLCVYCEECVASLTSPE